MDHSYHDSSDGSDMDVSESLSIASDSEQDAEDEEEVGAPETIGLFKVQFVQFL